MKHYLLIGSLVSLSSCSLFLPQAPDNKDILNAPIEGLSPSELSKHVRGDEGFARVFTSIDGLGPVFVQNSCESCHIADGKGHPSNSLFRFGRYTDQWDPLENLGGPQVQHRAISGITGEHIPPEATGQIQFLPPSVAGLGLIEAIPDNQILALADESDIDQDGISGRPHWIVPPAFLEIKQDKVELNGSYMGRFGHKAGAINLKHQIINAYHDDMGITSPQLPNDPRPQGKEHITDSALDPEIQENELQDVVFYVQTLQGPQRRNPQDPEVMKGQSIFMEIGCGKCHHPDFVSGESPVAALSNQPFEPYSDFLLHYLGVNNDENYIEGDAEAGEFRTTPLWGLGLSADVQGGTMFLMHNGKARSINEAIEMHQGEASAISAKYFDLEESERTQIVKFLLDL